MAKISVCDVCKKEGKLIESRYRLNWRNGIKVDLCEKHKNVFNGKNQEETMHLLHGRD